MLMRSDFKSASFFSMCSRYAFVLCTAQLPPWTILTLLVFLPIYDKFYLFALDTK